MEPITTIALLSLGKYLAKKGLEKAFDTTSEEVSKNAVNWVKNLFTKDGKTRNELIELQEKPDSPARLNAVKAIIERDLEDNPEAEKYLQEIYNKVLNINSNITNSKNVNTGTINSGGGNIQLGDNYGN
jgi:polyribonucleotide nucleotidyltransferase